MSLGFRNPALLWCLLGLAVPLLIHFWDRRRREVVDWGAAMFLDVEPGVPARRRPEVSEWLLLLTRMAVVGAPALAIARPLWTEDAARAGHAEVVAGNPSHADRDPGRTTILVLDGSSSMERTRDGSSIRERAISWARRYVRGLEPGHAVALLHAGARALSLVDPPTSDREILANTLARIEPGRGSSDLALALADSFRILERRPQSGCEVLLLTDDQRLAWRPDESPRWDLLRDLHGQLRFPPRLTALNFAVPAGTADGDEPDGALGPLALAGPLLTSSQPFAVTTALYNAGRSPLHRRVELLIDGRVAGSARPIGPVPPGGQVPVTFETAIAVPGVHELRAGLSTMTTPTPPITRSPTSSRSSIASTCS